MTNINLQATWKPLTLARKEAYHAKPTSPPSFELINGDGEKMTMSVSKNDSLKKEVEPFKKVTYELSGANELWKEECVTLQKKVTNVTIQFEWEAKKICYQFYSNVAAWARGVQFSRFKEV